MALFIIYLNDGPDAGKNEGFYLHLKTNKSIKIYKAFYLAAPFRPVLFDLGSPPCLLSIRIHKIRWPIAHFIPELPQD
jgi:hypothetical protein